MPSSWRRWLSRSPKNQPHSIQSFETTFDSPIAKPSSVNNSPTSCLASSSHTDATFSDVFKQIVGPKDLRYGNSLLADITVVKDSKQKDGQLSCNSPKIDAELLETDTDKPKLVVCPKAFTRGAFSGKGYPGAPVVTCDRCYPRISKKMDTIGTILLHEYTHWDKLMSPALRPGFSAVSTSDYCYGPFRTRLENEIIAPELAIWNGDSYAWLANEIWWTQACVSSHGALTAPLRSDN